MIGESILAGCLAILGHQPRKKAEEEALARLDSLIIQNTGRKLSSGVSVVQTTIGGIRLEALVFALEAPVGTTIFISFDHEQIENIALRTGRSFTKIFLPYVAVMQTVAGCQLVGIGIELSPPPDTDAASLKRAGIVQYWHREVENVGWMHRQFLPW